MDDCKLRQANGISSPCDTGACPYWRVIEHLDLPVVSIEGCAVQYFGLIEGGNSELAAWLLSVKDRMDQTHD